VRAKCPAVTVSPSEGVAGPAAQGQGAGLPEGFGRARTADRHPPSVGPPCCPGRRRRWPPRIVGGSPGPRGHTPSPCRGHGGVSRGPVWPGWATPVVPGGERRVWRPRAPLWGGCHARPAGGVIQGGARSDDAGGDGAPLPVYRGAVWPGWAIQAVPRGRQVWLPPPLGRLSSAPRWGSHPGGARSDAAGGNGAHLRVYRGHKNGAGEADGGRKGRPSTTGRYRTPAAPQVDSVPPPPLSPCRPRAPTRKRRPWHPRGRRVQRRRRR